jgi:hypothetical protein
VSDEGREREIMRGWIWYDGVVFDLPLILGFLGQYGSIGKERGHGEAVGGLAAGLVDRFGCCFAHGGWCWID